MKNSKLISSILILVAFTVFSFSCKKNQYVDGKKEGKWIEYLDVNFRKEVTKDSSIYYRVVEYENGYPKGLAKDYFTKSNKLQSEMFLISGPYLQNVERPYDKIKGIIKYFDEQTGKISDHMYYDEYGEKDLKKFCLTGLNEISTDKRFDQSIYSKESFLLLEKFNNNPELYEKEVIKIKTKLFDKYSEDQLNLRLFGQSILTEFIHLGLKELINSTDVNQTTNNNSNQYNSGYQGNSSTTTQQSNKKKCYHCNGTGRCPVCSVPQTVRYKKGEQPKDHKETRGGMVVCPQCGGNGMNWGHDENRACYLCNGTGWVKCPECNVGDGDHIGQCRKCKGSGIEY